MTILRMFVGEAQVLRMKRFFSNMILKFLVTPILVNTRL